MILPGDSLEMRKVRGAYFTPPAIAKYLAEWAIGGDADATVLDPTCGEAVFLLAAGERIRQLRNNDSASLKQQLHGVDLHAASLDYAARELHSRRLDANFIEADFFDIVAPDQLDSPVPYMDAVVGNPPFIRYQKHVGSARAKSRQAALRQSVRLSGLASSWAALLVHSCAFLKPEGRLAMVLPAELLTVGYAEPVRTWLRNRFEQVHLVLFEHLQFDGALEKVVLVLASGSGGCDAFSLYYVDDADDLTSIRPMSNLSVTPADEGKWTDLLLPNRARQLYRKTATDNFVTLGHYGRPELGTVTGANAYFALTDATARRFGLSEEKGQIRKLCPPGSKHFRGTSFTHSDWDELRLGDERVWLFCPEPGDESSSVERYKKVGESEGVPEAYKCKIRAQWWRPPAVRPPDLFFTYMSHRFPRLITNSAKTTFVNSMHGIKLGTFAPSESKYALPLLTLNSVTLLGAELHGRSYGGGILKMEPREAAILPAPSPQHLKRAWKMLAGDKARLSRQLAQGNWVNVLKQVDDALLRQTMGLEQASVEQLYGAAALLRSRRMSTP